MVLAIFINVLIDYLMGLDTPKLTVPKKFATTKEGRGWIINPFEKNHVGMWFAAILPALLATILVFMDQQITAVIVNRKENKLKVRNCIGQPKKNFLFLSFVERMWLSFGFINCHYLYCN